jgi:hypothetical protein
VQGQAFLPEWLLKNVRQYNNKYGDKPKNPPPNIPPAPLKPKFTPSKKILEKRNMEVSWDGLQLASMGVEWDASEMFQDLNREDVVPVHVPAPTIVSSVDTAPTPSLSLKSISTIKDIDGHLDIIEEQLVSSIESNKLAVDPTYAVMEFATPSASTDRSSDKSLDISNPMTLGDYDTYDFGTSQVKA